MEQTKAPPKSDYIRVKAAYTKMKTAHAIEQMVYLYEVTGCGYAGNQHGIPQSR